VRLGLFFNALWSTFYPIRVNSWLSIEAVYMRRGLTAALALALVLVSGLPAQERPAASTEAPSAGEPRRAVEAPPIREYPVLTARRLELLKAYMRLHYGTDSIALERPAMIVVHYTAIAALPDTLATFKRETLPASRTDIAGHGDVNVSIHYVIDRDGTVYRLQPENIVARHTIGFNWCALGIELVAAGEKQLTRAQLDSCARLVAWIVSRYPSVQYLIGHHEYMKKDLPPFVLYNERDPTFKPTVKIDPGAAFMRKLRDALATRYAILLKD
jgi:N-acetylmuramoyl-L-alanine amidase